MVITYYKVGFYSINGEFNQSNMGIDLTSAQGYRGTSAWLPEDGKAPLHQGLRMSWHLDLAGVSAAWAKQLRWKRKWWRLLKFRGSSLAIALRKSSGPFECGPLYDVLQGQKATYSI